MMARMRPVLVAIATASVALLVASCGDSRVVRGPSPHRSTRTSLPPVRVSTPRYGATADGGLATHAYDATAGASWNGGGLIATFKKERQDPIEAGQRAYTRQMAEPTTIYPGSTLRSGLLSLHQSLGDSAEFSLDALRTQRGQTTTSAYPGFYYLDRVDMLAGPGQNLLLGVLKGLQDRPAGRAVVLTSTQTSLRQMTSQGLMLPDLAFRLTAVRFAVPPLRQRKEEIGPLAQSLLAQLCNRYQQRPVALGPGALARLIQHDWPGNIRELSSVLEAALIDAANGVIRAEDLPIAANEQIPAQPQAMPRPENLDLDTVIRRHVEYVLDLNRGNKLRAARQLGISRSTL